MLRRRPNWRNALRFSALRPVRGRYRMSAIALARPGTGRWRKQWEDAPVLAWFGELNAKEKRAMAACFGGWSLDAFDVQMYSFVIPTVIALWGLGLGKAGLIGTVTLLVSSFGGWFSGAL